MTPYGHTSQHGSHRQDEELCAWLPDSKGLVLLTWDSVLLLLGKEPAVVHGSRFTASNPLAVGHPQGKGVVWTASTARAALWAKGYFLVGFHVEVFLALLG